MSRTKDTPLMDVIGKFTASSVPTRGEDEREIDAPVWKIGTEATPESYPGNGLAQHSMLYIGEDCNRMFLVHEGKIIWTFDSGKGYEYDDIWMKKNGNIVFSRMYWAGEVTPDKKLVWKFDIGENEEVHTMQPLDEDRVLMVINGVPPRAVIVNTKTNEVTYEHEVPYEPEHVKDVHGQFRRFRMTKDNTFLAPYLSLNKVVEYDMDFNVIWEYEIGKPWAAVRLLNGNTLITSESDRATREVNRNGEVVWEICLDELPAEYRLGGSQSCVRLKNGNTILCSMGAKGTTPQLVEVTPQKEVVWVLNDWRELGPATAIQILDDPGDPEVPGECER